MTPDWLLVETLGAEPAVVAQGLNTKNLVPISAFLRRNPHLMAIQTAIGQTVDGGKGLSSLTPKSDRVIRTELVRMTDGAIHGVHMWIGPPDADPPERPLPGPLKWDLTNGIATDTPESLRNSGRDVAVESTHGRAFAEDLPTRNLNANEAKVLALAIKPELGRTLCTTWDIADYEGEPITVGFVARILAEIDDGGREHLICRAMNWRGFRADSAVRPDDVGEQLFAGEAEPGVHRALVDLTTWRLLKWLDDPCPFYDWHAGEAGEQLVHPEDEPQLVSMTVEFGDGPVARVLRLRANGGGWTPIHVTVHRVELEPKTVAGLFSMRIPSAAELTPAPRRIAFRGKARAEKPSRA